MVEKRPHRVLTFEEWFTKEYMRIEQLDIKSLMAWAWSAGIEQAAHELLDPKLKDFSPSDQIRDLKHFCGEHSEFMYGGRRSDRPRRFLAIGGGASLKELAKIAKLMVPDGVLWRKEDLPPGAHISEVDSKEIGPLKAAGAHVVFIEIPQDWQKRSGTMEGRWAAKTPSLTISEPEYVGEMTVRDDLYPEKMMPGQSPYTPEGRLARDALISAAAQAEEIFGDDELEEHARKLRAERGWDIFNDPMIDKDGKVWFEVERDDEAALYADDEEPAREHFHEVVVDNRIWARDPKTEIGRQKVCTYLKGLRAELDNREEIQQGLLDPDYRTSQAASDAYEAKGEPDARIGTPDAQERARRFAEALDTEEGRNKVGIEMWTALRSARDKERQDVERRIRGFAGSKGIPVFDSEEMLITAVKTRETVQTRAAELRFIDPVDFMGKPPSPAERARHRMLFESVKKLASKHGVKIELFGPKKSLRMEHIPLEVRKWILESCSESLVRVSGDIVCAECNRPYNQHPEIAPTHVLLCGGRIGKL